MSTPESPAELPPTGLRRTVELPPALVKAFRAETRRSDGPPGTTLIYAWLADGVRRARTGQPLPQAADLPDSDGPNIGILWKQSPREFQAWKRDLEAAGSSVRALLYRRIERYLATGGDPVRAMQDDEEAGALLAS